MPREAALPPRPVWELMEGGVSHQGPRMESPRNLIWRVGEFHGPTLGGGRMGDGREQVLLFSKVRPTICWARFQLGLVGSAVEGSSGIRGGVASPFSSAPTAAGSRRGREATRSAMTFQRAHGRAPWRNRRCCSSRPSR